MAFPAEIAKFMETFGVTSDEVWKIPQGSAYAVKHKALERVAAEQKIAFEPPKVTVCDLANKMVAIVVSGAFKDRSEWASGEAAPYNNKNGYPFAMAEKRAKDRVILKLLNAHGWLYSEDEADDFKKRNKHTTAPEEIVPEVEYDEHGEPVDNIPSGEGGIERLPKAKARQDFEAAQKELRSTVTEKQLDDWGKRNANRVETFPQDWAAILRGIYIEHRDALRGKAA